MEKVDRAKENRNLTTGKLFKKIVLYLLPLFFANVLQLLFTTVDIFTVSKFSGPNGDLYASAIGCTGSLINIILCTFWGITNGAAIVIANAKGAKNIEKITRSVGSATLIIFIASIIVMIGGTLLAKPLLIALKTDEIFLEKATIYLIIYFLGTPFNLLYNTGGSILRALGDTRRPFVAVIVSGVINVILDFIFVYFLHMDVAGVALATIIAQGIAMVVCYLFLMKDKRLTANFKFRYLRIYKEEAKEILLLGITNGLQSFIFNFTNVFIQRCVNQLGEAAVLGRTASTNLEGYEYALLNSISATCMVAVSQNYGAKDKKRIKKSLLYCALLETFAVTILSGIICLAHKPLCLLVLKKDKEITAEAMNYALQSLMLIGLPYALCGIAECFACYLRGMKYSVTPTIVSLVCIVGVRMIFILGLFNLSYFHTYSWVIATYPLSWTACCIVYIPIVILLSKKKFRQMPELQKYY